MYIHVNVNRRLDQVINRNKLQVDRRVFFHFLVCPDALSPLTHQMKTRQLKNACVEMRYERNLFAVLYVPGLSGNLLYLTNDLLVPQTSSFPFSSHRLFCPHSFPYLFGHVAHPPASPDHFPSCSPDFCHENL